jgi:hypothetical protein
MIALTTLVAEEHMLIIVGFVALHAGQARIHTVFYVFLV